MFAEVGRASATDSGATDGDGGAGVSTTQPDDGVAARLDLYRYVTAENADDYLAIMRLFTSTLLADLSAAEVVAHLPDRDPALGLDDAEARCRQLEQWGNLVRSVRDARVASVADYLRSRSRFQVSKLGGRVHRQVDEVIQAADGVRDVARELLGGVIDTLDRIMRQLTGPVPTDADALAADPTTVFASQRLFTESVRDFDWPGMSIAGRLIHAGAKPWRLAEGDYADAVECPPPDTRLALTGRPSATAWDEGLAGRMARTGVAVHEESLLPVLLADLISAA